jgi:hypothetical protein
MNGNQIIALVCAAALSALSGCVAEEEDGHASNTEATTEAVCGDNYGINDSAADARRLMSMADMGGNDWTDLAALGGVPDSPVGFDTEDWYVFEVVDHWLATLKPAVSLIDESLEPAANVTNHIEVCAFSTLPAEDVECEVGTEATYQDLAGCCAIAKPDSPSTTGGLVIDAESVIYDDTSDVYVRVRLAAGAEGIPCAEYRLGYNAYGTY